MSFPELGGVGDGLGLGKGFLKGGTGFIPLSAASRNFQAHFLQQIQGRG